MMFQDLVVWLDYSNNNNNILVMDQYLLKTNITTFLKDQQSNVNISKDVVDLIGGLINNQQPAYYNSDDQYYIYTVPKLGDGGTCSLKHETEIFDLTTVVGQRSEQLSSLISRLYQITKAIQKLTDVDWIGIYKVYQVNGEKCLTKLAYQGEISRPLFPLNSYWETISNNSFVGINGKGKIIQSLESYDGPYYNCSDKVKSELCIPIFDRQLDQVIGIIDAESWKDTHFNDKNILELSQLAVDLSTLLSDPLLLNK
ncbi:hypothetical protein PPL_01924 [Heterostelium album PN500]|uniref:GAF domain-containing protein n=1 Tax=Heterostelium pallidum (strain ATCC 26659 / Pp 5 / PN500) TaxID=670386 RepID=D3B0V7_HETP5|nr:hypothetical protein PPL_01924 [Heterostelium album PN500]EFA84931.1 hypothetical protein PPL_01924 [Heterostelium album PN500]|eukprot:XP_020437041.1 hypothetical protein PPL_01924 [Heterostelium album PN500]